MTKGPIKIINCINNIFQNEKKSLENFFSVKKSAALSISFKKL